MLTNGLDILRLLAEADQPLTATMIAERIGLHPSNVSRTLRVLIEAGYVRKPTYHSFAVDLGVVALAGQAVRGIPLISRTAAPIQALADHAGVHATLGAMFRDEILYLHQAVPGGHMRTMAGGFPLHRSVVALRLLLDLPAGQAVGRLEASRRRYGWERPTAQVPADATACLEAARSALGADGVLVLDGWNGPGHVQTAIPLPLHGQPPLVLALDGIDARPAALRAALALACPALRAAVETP